MVTPIKKDGIRRKERPTDKGVSWLVKTQYISPLSLDSAKQVDGLSDINLFSANICLVLLLLIALILQSLTEKQAKELREMKGGRNILENLNDRFSLLIICHEIFLL